MFDIKAIFLVLLSVAATLVTSICCFGFISLNIIRYSYYGSIYFGMYVQRKYLEWTHDPANPKLEQQWYNEMEEGFDSPYVDEDEDEI